MRPGFEAFVGLKCPEPYANGVAGFPVSSVSGFPRLSFVSAA